MVQLPTIKGDLSDGPFRTKMTRSQYKKFLQNAGAAATNESMAIDLGSFCGVGCTFCFNESDFTERLVHIPMISEEDFEDALDFVNVYRNPVITLGGGKHIWWGEPTAHPKLVQFCRRINERFPEAIIEIDTAGLYLTDEKIRELQEIRNLQLYLSVNTLDEKLRKQFYKLDRIDRVYAILERLPVQVANIKYHGDPRSMVRDVRLLAEYPGIVFISPHKIHWTRFSDSAARGLSEASLATWGICMEEVYGTCDDPRVIAECNFMHDATDQKSRLFSAFKKLLDDAIALQFERHGRSFTLCCAESAFKFVKDHHSSADAICVKNDSYGGSISASGQLNFEDVVRAIALNPRPRGTKYIVPSDMMNDRGCDRLGVYIKDVDRVVLEDTGCRVEEAHLKRWIYLPLEYMQRHVTGK